MSFCHCTRCRKANGSAFLAASQVLDPATLKVDDPDAKLRFYESSPGVLRYFCSHRGSPMYSRRPGTPEIIRLRIGTLDTPCPVEPKLHIYYADKAEWYEALDDVPKHEGR